MWGRIGWLLVLGTVWTVGLGEETQIDLTLGDKKGWSFLGGEWSESGEGVISPPDQWHLHSRAFYSAKGFGDVTVRFEYQADYREVGSGDAGLILRAADGAHFYLIHFPWGGQQLRAKHFWGGIAKVEGDGYLRHLRFAMVPGVPSETSRWYQVQVEAAGPRIRVWVDGRRAFEASDDGWKSGFVGLAGYGRYSFRNIHISGTEVPAPSWDPKVQISQHASELPFTSELMPSGCVSGNGDVLLAAGNVMLRSTDKGRTWSKEALPEKLGAVNDYGNTMFRDSKGRLIVFLWTKYERAKKSVPEIALSESTDYGKTWSDPVPSKVQEGWPADPAALQVYGPLMETADGTLLRFLLGRVEPGSSPFTDVVTWGAIRCKAFCIRSTDGGTSWSAPIELDRPV